jgi:hypothetical protein
VYRRRRKASERAEERGKVRRVHEQGEVTRVGVWRDKGIGNPRRREEAWESTEVREIIKYIGYRKMFKYVIVENMRYKT